MRKKAKKEPPPAAAYGWTCVACGWVIDRRTLFASNWFQARGGRLCPRCHEKLAAAGPGNGFKLGAGWRLTVSAC